MRLHHLNCGTLCPPFGRFLQGKGHVLGRGRFVCHCLLVESRAGLLLVDTGLGTRDVQAPVKRLGAGFVAMTGPAGRMEETALAQVRALGFDPADVRHVLPTHLDLDHAGGLADFPEAQVHLLRREHDAATRRPTPKERLRYRKVHFAHAPRWQLHDPGGERWFGFESVRPLQGTDDEVLLIPLYGHTRGHAGVAVRTESGWLLHAGDAYFHHAMVHPTGRKVPPGLRLFDVSMQTDARLRLHNQARLRELILGHGDEVQVVCAHDPDEFAACAS